MAAGLARGLQTADVKAGSIMHQSFVVSARAFIVSVPADR
jgi:hypothetical protein